jgi:hypothetical protein
MTMTASHATLWFLLLAVLACLLAKLLGRRLMAALARLVKVTTNLPDKLLRHQAIAWTYSLVTDIEALAGTFNDGRCPAAQCPQDPAHERDAELSAGTHPAAPGSQQLGKEIPQRAQTEDSGGTHGTS